MVPLIISVFGAGFFAGQFFAFKRLKPSLPEGTKLELSLPFSSDNSASTKPPRPTSSPPKKAAVSGQPQRISGPITEQKPVPLTINNPDEVERSGWGNAFDLLSANAEPTTVIDGELVYNWFVEIKSKRNRDMLVHVSVRLMDDNDEMVGKSSEIKAFVSALGTEKIKGQLGIAPELENEVVSVHANVRSK